MDPFYDTPCISKARYGQILSCRVVVSQHTRSHKFSPNFTILWLLHQFVSLHSGQPLDIVHARSLVESNHILLCHDLAGIAQKNWHAETARFVACDQEHVVVDLVLCV